MAAMPRDFEMLGEFSVIFKLSSEISPESGTTAPVRILIRVDLPAPFSPTSAWTSPARSSNDASRSACTPAYDFVTFPALSSGSILLILLILDHDHMQLAWAVHADRESQFNI